MKSAILSTISFVTLFEILWLGIFLFGCVQQRTVELCSAMPIEYGQRDQCFRQLALETKNASVCAFINDKILKDYWCYREMAYDKKSNATCEFITDEDAKQSCYDVVSGKQRFERGR